MFFDISVLSEEELRAENRSVLLLFTCQKTDPELALISYFFIVKKKQFFIYAEILSLNFTF